MSPSVITFLRIRQKLQKVSEVEGVLSAYLEFDPADTELAKDLSNLEETGVITEVRRNGELEFSRESRGRLDVKVDRSKLDDYFETYDSLIIRYPFDPPAEITVWQKNDDLDKGYAAACSFLKLLTSKAEVWDKTARRLFLVDQQAIRIPLEYGAQQTTGLDSALPVVTKFLDASLVDDDVRWALFRKASSRLLRDLPENNRLGFLMEKLADVFQRANEDYSLYLERFSFEDLVKNFDEKRLKFVDDLNQVLSSIQTALIAVPIGFFLIAEKFKPASGLIGANIVLAAGALVFFALLFVLSLNQGKALKGVKLALADFETEQVKKVTERSERLNTLITTTKSQFRRVAFLLHTVRILLFLFSLIVIATLLWCSIPSWQQRFPYTTKGTDSAQNRFGPKPISTRPLPNCSAPRETRSRRIM